MEAALSGEDKTVVRRDPVSEMGEKVPSPVAHCAMFTVSLRKPGRWRGPWWSVSVLRRVWWDPGSALQDLVPQFLRL